MAWAALLTSTERNTKTALSVGDSAHVNVLMISDRVALSAKPRFFTTSATMHLIALAVPSQREGVMTDTMTREEVRACLGIKVKSDTAIVADVIESTINLLAETALAAMDERDEAALRARMDDTERQDWRFRVNDQVVRAKVLEKENARLRAERDSARSLGLTWDGEQWRFPCGCALHPDDDNGTHGGGPHVHSPDCTKGHKADGESLGEVRAEVARLQAQVEALRDVGGHVLEHLRELEEAWRRGVISEHDGKGGLRSNTNVWRANELAAALDAATTEG